MGGGVAVGAGTAAALALSAYVLLRPGSRLRREMTRRRESHQRARFEDLLKHIFNRRLEGKDAGIESVAGHLAMPEAKVLRLIMKAEAAGLLRSEGDRLALTREGEKWALQVVRAHRLWETYLANEARLAMTDLHGPAEKEEHRLTAKEQVDALDAFLGHPRSDPHGDPIPTAAGEIVPPAGQPLTTWTVGRTAEISHIEDEPAPFLREITGQGLRPGSVVRVTERTQGQLTINDGVRDYHLPPLMAGNIQVIPVTQPALDRLSLSRLCDLAPGEEGEVVQLDKELRGFTRRRLLDLGLTTRSRVRAQLANAFGDPLAYRVRGTTIALRREQASKIWVKRVKPAAAREAPAS